MAVPADDRGQGHWLEVARRLGREVLAPRADQYDREEAFPQACVEAMAAQGLFGLIIPQAYGGQGASASEFAAVVEELSRHCAASALVFCVHSSVAATPVTVFGNDEQKEAYLPGLARGDILGAFALTEPDFGSDAGSIQATARSDPDGWIIDGGKIFITNASRAGLFVTLASSDRERRSRGITAFLVPKDTAGLTVGKKEEKMGMRSSDTCELRFEEVRLPHTAVLGKINEGFKVAMMTLDGGRIGIGAQAVGIAQGALDAALDWVKTKQRAGRPTSQADSFRLADAASRVNAARTAVRHAARLKDEGVRFSQEAAMAKLFATRTASWVTRQAMELTGPAGLHVRAGVERRFREARVTEIYEGTSEMQSLVIARVLLK